MGSKKTTTTQSTTPYGPSQPGVDYSQKLATEGLKSATPYSGRFSPQTSNYTFGALDSLKNLIPQTQGYGQNALNIPDYLYDKVMSGGYRPATYDPTTAIDSAVRPVVEKYSENLMPGLSALMTQSGGYQGKAPGGVSNTAGDSLARNLTREISQVAGEQSLAAADLNSRNLLAALGLENTTLGGLPGMYAQGLTAAQLPSQLQGQIGAGEEAIAMRDIQEALQQNQYGNLWEASIAGPYQDILMGPAQAFGTTVNTTKQKADPVTQAIQAIAAVGSFFGGGGPGSMDAFAMPTGPLSGPGVPNQASPGNYFPLVGPGTPGYQFGQYSNPYQGQTFNPYGGF